MVEFENLSANEVKQCQRLISRLDELDKRKSKIQDQILKIIGDHLTEQLHTITAEEVNDSMSHGQILEEIASEWVTERMPSKLGDILDDVCPDPKATHRDCKHFVPMTDRQGESDYNLKLDGMCYEGGFTEIFNADEPICDHDDNCAGFEPVEEYDKNG